MDLKTQQTITSMVERVKVATDAQLKLPSDEAMAILGNMDKYLELLQPVGPQQVELLQQLGKSRASLKSMMAM